MNPTYTRRKLDLAKDDARYMARATGQNVYTVEIEGKPGTFENVPLDRGTLRTIIAGCRPDGTPIKIAKVLKPKTGQGKAPVAEDQGHPAEPLSIQPPEPDQAEEQEKPPELIPVKIDPFPLGIGDVISSSFSGREFRIGKIAAVNAIECGLCGNDHPTEPEVYNITAINDDGGRRTFYYFNGFRSEEGGIYRIYSSCCNRQPGATPEELTIISRQAGPIEKGKPDLNFRGVGFKPHPEG